MTTRRRSGDARPDPSLRRLIACQRCLRQYDVSWRAVGNQFRCSCGESLVVPAARSHEAEVVRCSSCGAPRGDATTACGFCGADFTLHERDLHTICPRCATRISDRARYCHNCATLIAPTGSAGVETGRPCPACGEVSRLVSRALGGRRVSVLECGRCAGMWLGNEVFQHLERAARNEAVSAEGSPPEGARAPVATAADESPRRYRPCPICSSLMHRRNYGRKSGVILDTCRQHGVWFDQGELDAILDWVRQGGLERAERHLRLMDAEEERARRASLRAAGARSAANPLAPAPARSVTDFIEGVLGFLRR